MTNNYKAVKSYQKRCIAKGICSTGCGKPLRTITLCDECAKKKTLRARPKVKQKLFNLRSQGLCVENCGRKLHTKWYCEVHAEKHRKRSYIRYRKDITRSRAKGLALTHKRNFGGLRDIILLRDNKCCQICGYSKKILVHHINEIPKENTMQNLITLCYICHVVVERINRTKPNLFHLFPWIK